MLTVGHLVRAESAVEAAALGYLRLPAAHRAAAVLVECEPDPWIPAGVSPLRPELGWQPQGWNVTFALPTMTVADALVPDYPWNA